MPANPFDTIWSNDVTTGSPRSNDPTSGSSIPAWLQSIIAGGAGYAMNNGPGDTTTRTATPAPWDVDLGIANSQRGLDIGAMPFTPYDGNMVAGFSPDQFAGMDMIRNSATNNQLPGQAGAALGNMFANGGNMAPTSSNPYMGATTSAGSNPWEGKTTSVGTNPYAGSNPYLEQNIQNTMGDMARTYNQQVAPTMAANAYQSGSFGNTGQQEMENESRNQLQQNLGRTSANMRMQDYGMQQGLAESDITRRMNAQQTDYSRNANIADAGLSRSMQGQIADLSRNANIYATDASLNSNNFNTAQNRMLSGLNMAPSIYNMGFTGGNALLGIGGSQQALGQQDLSAQRAEFDRAQQWPFQTGQYMSGALRGQGGTTTTTDPAPNPWAGAVGASGLWNIFNQPRPPG